MNDYEKGMTDALAILQACVEDRCKLVDGMRESMRVLRNGPHLADNDLGGLLNSQHNIYQGLKIDFETRMMQKITELRRKERKP